MIKKNDSISVFSHNIERSNMLITAMEKIKGYNRLYQFKAYDTNLKYGKLVTEVQDNELIKIEKSCAEHAIISLATACESFFKELLQELLFKYPKYFSLKKTKLSEPLNNLFNSTEVNDYESISKLLNIKNRFDIFELFKTYNLTILLETEHELVEYIFIWRNCFVHNGGILDQKMLDKLSKTSRPFGEIYLATESKRLRTRVSRLIPKIHERVIKQIIKKNTDDVALKK